MKISPIASGSGIPAGSVGSESTPQDRKEAAKEVFLGKAKLTPSETPIDPQVTKAQDSIRRIKMRTNVSPDRAPELVEAIQPQM